MDWDGDGEIDEWTDYVDSEEVEIDCGGHAGTAWAVSEDGYGASGGSTSVESKDI